MNAPADRRKIHFARLDPAGSIIDLARALGAGNSGPADWAKGPDQKKFQQLNDHARDYFEPVGIEQADLIVYPHPAEQGPEVLAVSEDARRRGLPCYFFNWGDEDKPVNVPYGIVYRHSIFSDKRFPCEKAWPAWTADMLESSRFAPREKSDRPSVGFCGFVGNPISRRLYRLMGRDRKAIGLELRARLLNRLGRSDRLETRFIYRQSYWAGSAGRFHRSTTAQFSARQQFVENLIGCDYAVSIRGAGNFSYRFYEVLSAGRIPLFVNTKCVLPLEDEIDWRQHCVWVEESEMDRAGEILADSHANLTPERFIQMQQSNRRLWEESLTPLGFYRRVLGRAGSFSSAGTL
jgi:hypothetical protein